jgi:hypothetical protein
VKGEGKAKKVKKKGKNKTKQNLSRRIKQGEIVY